MSKQFQEYVDLADHYKAIGMTELYISDMDEYPWEHVTKITSGGSHRLEIDTTLWLYAEHPCGLTFRWSFDVETRAANGHGYYDVNVAGLQHLASVLPPGALDQIRSYLDDVSRVLERNADNYQEIADRERAQASTVSACMSFQTKVSP